MRVRWVKVWVDSLASLTERFRDEEGRVDFEALGREEYAFRHALVTGDFSRSERARDLYDATINEITSRSEAGRKGAEARWSRNTAAAATREGVDVIPSSESCCSERTTGCNHSQVAPTSNAGDESSDAGNGAALKSATACNSLTADGDIREDSLNIRDTGDRGILESGTSANHYNQETDQVSSNSPACAGVNLDSAHTISPDASSGNAEGVISHGSHNGRSRAACTTATSGQTIEALQNTGAAGDSHEFSSSPAVLPVPAKRPHGEFGNVMLTDDELAKLQEKTPDAWELITELDQYIESQGKTKKYKSHYATLLNWSRRKAQESKPKQGYMTSDDISKKNYQESKARLEAMFSNGRKTA